MVVCLRGEVQVTLKTNILFLFHSLQSAVSSPISLCPLLPCFPSRAICCYLATQYGKDDSFCPNNPKTRAIVESRLDFDLGILMKRFADYAVSV